jgi:hypothetical protein
MALVDWQQADFRFCPPSGRAQPPDPWQERRPPSDAFSGNAARRTNPGDWFDELRSAAHSVQVVPRCLPTGEPVLESTLESIEFDPNARQAPWRSEITAGGRATSRARQKAASLVACFEFSRACERAAALASLTELFEEFEHSTTYQALLDQTRTGLEFETIAAMADLKRLWLMMPTWWSRRRFCRIRRRSEYIHDRAGAAALSWKLARRICETRWRWPVELMIPEAWFAEWLQLPFRLHRCWSFAQFTDWRLDRDPEDQGALYPPEPSLDSPRPAPLAWQEVAASATSLAELLATRSDSTPDQLQ